MLRGITVRQFQEWRAYADLEPFDEERADARAASIVQAIYNSPRRKKDRLKLQECLLSFGEQPSAAATDEQKLAQTRRTLDMLFALHGPKGKMRKK
jgi:hypothetical protein